MKKVFCFAVIIFFANPLMSFSRETRSDTNEIAALYAECAAYYRLASHGRNSTNAEKTPAVYRRLENTAMFYSLLLAIEGGGQDMAVAATHSRSNMYMEKLEHEAAGRNEKLSLILQKYHSMCQDAMENPPGQLVEILRTMLQK